MATSFSDIYGFARALLQDTDPDVIRYPDSVLDSHITIVANSYLLKKSWLETSGNTFLADLTEPQKVEAALYAVKSILSGIPDKFEYKVPIIGVKRHSSTRKLLSLVEELLGELSGGKFPVLIQHDYEASFQYVCQRIEDLSNAGSGD